MLKTIKTTPYQDQKMGTAGLRKRTKVFTQENYAENFIQSIFNSVGGVEGYSYILGGDGRYFNKELIQKVIKLAAGNGVKRLIVGQNGYIATPAGSRLILLNKFDGGIMLTASHNPGGVDGDVGVKYSNETGGQIGTSLSNKIFETTKTITEYKIFDNGDLDISKIGTFQYGNMQVEVINAIEDYADMLAGIFDFDAIKKLFQSGFKMKFDSMNAVTGPYAVRIFEEILGAEKGSVMNSTPLEDFGGLHPDPNLRNAKQLLDIMYSDKAPDFAGAADGDGDRYMILGKKFFVSPSDSLAILADKHKLIPAYKDGIFGVAKSAATSASVAKVAKAHNIGYYETPTGWKYFVNLMDAKRITLCGEESFGSSSNHIREKDSIWAVLFWLNIIAKTGKTVAEITKEHWEKYGRNYYLRHDFEEIDSAVANKMIADMAAKLPSLKGDKFAGFEVLDAAPFVYTDPVDHSVNQDGYIIKFTDSSRIIYRLSGTGSVGATLRIYIDRYVTEGLNEDANEVIKDLYQYALKVIDVLQRSGKQQADVIT